VRRLRWLGSATALACVGLGACSDPAAPTVIIVHDAPASGGQSPSSTAAGGAPPVTFAGGLHGGAAGASGPAPSSPPTSAPTSSAPVPPEGAGGTQGAGGAASTPGLPCDVATYLAMKCQSCHGSPPIPSALAALVSVTDLKATAKEDPTKNEAELSVARMKDAARPMPPGALPSAADVAVLQDWISAGYPTGSCAARGGGDGGASPPPPPPPASVFKDAPAFVARTGPSAHNAGKDCMSCHRNGGGEAPRFSFGGTLYDASGKPVAGAEVRVLDANGKATSVYTSATGTFYSGATFAAPAHVGLRNATASEDMLTLLDAQGGACSSCHCSGGTCTVPPIHLP
jgi:hypothetical protein